jgi:hypothetical protein
MTSTSNSKLKFGNEAILTGDGVVATPLITKPSTPPFYYLNLEGITINTKTVSTGRTDGNIIIDSGSVLTFLTLNLYTDFVTSLQSFINVEAEQEVPYPFDFCFKVGDDTYLPNVVLQFTGASVPLNPEHLFVLDDINNMLCLAVIPVVENGISILGNLAQVGFQVEYDVGGKKIYFAPNSDCTANHLA